MEDRSDRCAAPGAGVSDAMPYEIAGKRGAQAKLQASIVTCHWVVNAKPATSTWFGDRRAPHLLVHNDGPLYAVDGNCQFWLPCIHYTLFICMLPFLPCAIERTISTRPACITTAHQLSKSIWAQPRHSQVKPSLKTSKACWFLTSESSHGDVLSQRHMMLLPPQMPSRDMLLT